MFLWNSSSAFEKTEFDQDTCWASVRNSTNSGLDIGPDGNITYTTTPGITISPPKSITGRSIGAEVEISTTDAQAIYQQAVMYYNMTPDAEINVDGNWCGGNNIIEIKMEKPFGLGNDLDALVGWGNAIDNIYHSTHETGQKLIYGCTYSEDKRQVAATHVRVGYNNGQDRKKLITAAKAYMPLLSLLSNPNNIERIDAIGMKPGVGEKQYEISDDSDIGALEIRGIPTSNSAKITYSIPNIVAAFINYLDFDPNEIHKTEMLAENCAGGKSYNGINRERVLNDGENAIIYVVSDGYHMEERPILDILDEKIDRMMALSIESGEQIIDENTYMLYKRQISDYRSGIITEREEYSISIPHERYTVNVSDALTDTMPACKGHC